MPFGEYQYNLDGKGRMVVPVAFRKFIEDGLVSTRGMEGCLYVFPLATWQHIEEQLEGLPLTDAEARSFVRFFYSGAAKLRMDSASRILVPPTLRQFAQLESNVIVAGAPSRLEIWNEERWWHQVNDAMNNPPASDVLRGLTG